MYLYCIVIVYVSSPYWDLCHRNMWKGIRDVIPTNDNITAWVNRGLQNKKWPWQCIKTACLACLYWCIGNAAHVQTYFSDFMTLVKMLDCSSCEKHYTLIFSWSERGGGGNGEDASCASSFFLYYLIWVKFSIPYISCVSLSSLLCPGEHFVKWKEAFYH